MSEIFTWVPDVDPQAEDRPEVTVVSLGDGYETRQAFGTNTLLEKWNLKFSLLDKTEYDEIIAFLRARAGTESFDWIPPDAVTARKFVSRGWSTSRQTANRYTITTSFDEIAEPDAP